MSSDPKQRQKRIAKKAAKRKILSTAKKTIHQAGINWEAIKQMTAAAASPLYESLVAETLFDEGLGNVIFSRKMRNGLIAAGVFLVDVFCLGIKDCFFTVLSPLDYQNFLDRSSAHGALETWHPTCTVKLIRDAVAYAGDLGFNPIRTSPSLKKF